MLVFRRVAASNAFHVQMALVGTVLFVASRRHLRTCKISDSELRVARSEVSERKDKISFIRSGALGRCKRECIKTQSLYSISEVKDMKPRCFRASDM